MKKFLCSALLAMLMAHAVSQTSTTKKYYTGGQQAGDALLLEEWFESDGRQSSVFYTVDIKAGGKYSVKAITNMTKGAYQWVTDNGQITGLRLNAQGAGWQQSAAEMRGNAKNDIYMAAGRHTLRFTMNGNMPPLNDAISLSRNGVHTRLDEDWQRFSAKLNRWMNEPAVNTEPLNKTAGTETEKTLPNPEGNYEHAIDTAFSYTTFQYVSLTAGVTYTFATVNSTTDPVLHVFDVAGIDTRSWADDDSGPGSESLLTFTAPVSGFYCLMVRPYSNTQGAVTTVQQNGVNILTTTPLGGLRLTTTQRTGELNYFTSRLAGNTYADTRIFTMAWAGTAVTGYNDDYANSTGGTFAWNLASRIKKNFAVGNSVVFVSAYSATRTGVCDVYMGNTPGQIPVVEPYNFPNFKQEDAIQSAPYNGNYNCISWSGGITNSWTWPPDPFSSWHVVGNELAGFDKFYSNTPSRYPGAWNYSRSGATAANAVVDLWKRPAGNYQHASVTKPGNHNPHGYDWESKPGGLDRQFHPRNALEKNEWYGVVTNYYKFTGTYTPILTVPIGPLFKGFATDADAVKAGVAVYENAQLSVKAQEKLRNLLIQSAAKQRSRFEELYQAWQRTWSANASLSDPYAYSNNAEYEALENYSKANCDAAMLLVFEKFVNGQHLTTKLLWQLTYDRYGTLLNEAKGDIERNAYDEQGRYKIHGDHDNGIRYIEKILNLLQAQPAETVTTAAVTVSASPNPVKDVLTITVDIKTASRIGVNATSAQTRAGKPLQQEVLMLPGTYRYQLSVKGFAGTAGDVISVQVRVNGQLQTYKVLVQ
jgi:hypothetical protein